MGRKIIKVFYLFITACITFLVLAIFAYNQLTDSNQDCSKCSSCLSKPDEKGDATSIHKLAVLIPFRDRFEELQQFIPYMHKFLIRQRIRHKFIVINQYDNFRFNRGALLNVGFIHSQHDCDYIALHDVDLLPGNFDLSYSFPRKGPFHLAAPHLHPIYHYKKFVGGIMLMTNAHYKKVDGLSNKYWGWGREDDEFGVRLKQANLTIDRPGNLSTGFNTFIHIHNKIERKRDSAKYFQQKKRDKRRDRITGLSTVQYTVKFTSRLVIDDAPVEILNVQLQCDLNVTWWCLKPAQILLLAESGQIRIAPEEIAKAKLFLLREEKWKNAALPNLQSLANSSLGDSNKL